MHCDFRPSEELYPLYDSTSYWVTNFTSPLTQSANDMPCFFPPLIIALPFLSSLIRLGEPLLLPPPIDIAPLRIVPIGSVWMGLIRELLLEPRVASWSWSRGVGSLRSPTVVYTMLVFITIILIFRFGKSQVADTIVLCV